MSFFGESVAPNDGHCLYHAMVRGLRQMAEWRSWHVNAALAMREQVAQFVLDHPEIVFGGFSIRQWIRAETGSRYGNTRLP